MRLEEKGERISRSSKRFKEKVYTMVEMICGFFKRGEREGKQWAFKGGGRRSAAVRRGLEKRCIQWLYAYYHLIRDELLRHLREKERERQGATPVKLCKGETEGWRGTDGWSQKWRTDEDRRASVTSWTLE